MTRNFHMKLAVTHEFPQGQSGQKAGVLWVRCTGRAAKLVMCKQGIKAQHQKYLKKKHNQLLGWQGKRVYSCNIRR